MVRSVGEGPMACQKQTASALFSGSPDPGRGLVCAHHPELGLGGPAQWGHSTVGYCALWWLVLTSRLRSLSLLVQALEESQASSCAQWASRRAQRAS